MVRPFRFAVQSLDATSGQAWTDFARAVEDFGFSTLHVSDHLLGPGPALAGSHHPPQGLAVVPAIAHAAAVTSTLRVGCRVFCIDYRNPTVLAKEAATIDLLSAGRLELGLGAGWWRGEYEAIGIPFDSPARRIARLERQVVALKRYFSGELLEIADPDVTMLGFAGSPRPVQQPHPPIMIGGGGRRVLGLAGRHADIVSININAGTGSVDAMGARSSDASALSSQIASVRTAAGERFDRLELELGLYDVAITHDPDPHLERLQRRYGFTRGEAISYPHALIGTVSSASEELMRRREVFGVSYFTVFAWSAREFVPVVEALRGR